MRVTSKGQVTIPRDLRELVGIEPNSDVIFGIEGGVLTIAPKDGGSREADRERLKHFVSTLDRLAGTGDQSIDADELMRITRDR
ncbi:AbrB/MazE/SpoVT family DNA-binding domain-containing protein [Pararhizobium sp.]|uniref:AbrB/MazE/SpoVT family DNA-binding domain-containing protein n=1 Tax=Pararhizobium sp. TaxID=1977563 RepID=UPI002726F477|nr:AbrB/MazE/SpoVT family DNA-binding domain-containing protein [Pararhizobium sp.]MDO9415124.1 AbrB/MazE/SpoVT family DNA-binding domain-containing protein [Pararhizobium sp.]